MVAVLAPPPSGSNEVSRLGNMARDTGAVGLCIGTTGFNLGHLGLSSSVLPRQLVCLTTTDEAAGPAPAAWTEPAIGPDTLAFLQYTSGSTGPARCVAVSHANVLHNQRAMHSAFKGSPRTRAVSWLPPHHGMGLVGHVVQTMHLGITSVLMSPAAFLAKPARWLQAISDHRATISGGPNYAYELCIRRVTGEQMHTLDLRTWSVAYNGSEMVRAQTLERFADKFAPCGFRRAAFVGCYGLAEATLFVTAGPRATLPAVDRVDGEGLQRHRVQAPGAATRDVRRIVSCGRPTSQQVLIVDPDTRLPCPPDRVGEIWIRGASVAGGYWNDAEATARTFQARLAHTGEGPWLRTGDLGYLRAGELHVTGRLDDLVVIAGRRYDPRDIEDAVRASHPALSEGEAAAFSIDAGGEGRLVVMQEMHRQGLQRARRPALAKAARSAVLARFGIDLEAMVLLPEGRLPRTSSGTIRRAASREAYLRAEVDAAA
jgi:acyl-CoA synthetase (AMP-forming)/AMP-acid ligase II